MKAIEFLYYVRHDQTLLAEKQKALKTAKHRFWIIVLQLAAILLITLALVLG